MWVPSPVPAHGFALVTLAAWLYGGLVFGLGYGLVRLGLPPGASLPVMLVGALALLKPFVPVFRRLAPDRPEVE